MVKLQDFAQSMGVTDRAIQKHIKKYAAELDGLIERKGPNGTWLTDEACELLRSKMKQLPLAILEADPRAERLEERVRELENRLDEKDRILTFTQKQVMELQEKAGRVLQLEADNAAAEERAKKAEGALDVAVGEKLDLQTRLEDAQRQLEEAEAENERLKKRGLIARIFNLKE